MTTYRDNLQVIVETANHSEDYSFQVLDEFIRDLPNLGIPDSTNRQIAYSRARRSIAIGGQMWYRLAPTDRQAYEILSGAIEKLLEENFQLTNFGSWYQRFAREFIARDNVELTLDGKPKLTVYEKD